MPHRKTPAGVAVAVAWAMVSAQAAAQTAATPVATTAPAGAPDADARPSYETVSLNGGFTVDPFPIGVIAGGPYSVAGLGPDCVGNITPGRADAKIEFENGQRPLSIYAAAGSDVALLVHTPAGAWVCADDSDDGGINPAITFQRPANGTYAVWVAAVDTSTRPVPAVLVISELPPTW
ncbi:peptidase S1 [Inquilinus limosus]|uniref:Peptidase S1 n=1 Tax=Inquilinus limosus TaxID=171674 RepID=A0A211YSG5_9PROT|nr:peptidase S1 [Inquilinus limosus]OWJ55896.1 hypothetical protein BWR60_35675 [Inquilinus limosus]